MQLVLSRNPTQAHKSTDPKTKPNDIASLDGKELIKSKEKALQDINELLLRKQWILSEI